jgi:hypothetical protein
VPQGHYLAFSFCLIGINRCCIILTVEQAMPMRRENKRTQFCLCKALPHKNINRPKEI